MQDNKLYGIKDIKADCFRFFVFHYNDAVAFRSFKDEVNREDDRHPSLIMLHPQDFSLYFLGDINQDKGSVICPTEPVLIVNGASLVDPDVKKNFTT